MYTIKYDLVEGDFTTLGIEIECETWQEAINIRKDLKRDINTENIEIYYDEY